jgi:hypothetical protein
MKYQTSYILLWIYTYLINSQVEFTFMDSIWETKLSLDAQVNNFRKRQLIILTSGNYNFFRNDEGSYCQKKKVRKTHNRNK